MSAQIDRKKDHYPDKLAKLLPAEGTAALVAIENLVPNESGADIWMLFAIVVIAIFVYLWAKQFRNITDHFHLIFLVLGFLIWASNIVSGRFDEYYSALFGAHWFSFIPAMLAILYTLFIPLFFRK